MRLYFNIVRGDELIPDEEGFDARDVNAAIAVAAETIRQAQGEDHGFASRCRGRKLVITNESGDIIASFELGLSLQCFWLSSLIQPDLLKDVMDMLSHPFVFVC
jgi:hypothetical protein